MPARRLKDRLRTLRRQFHETWGTDISTPEARRRAWWDMQITDHSFLRRWWRNTARVADGVYRANQPSPQRIAEYAKGGIRSIVNLRGESRHSHYLFEKEACDAHGIALVNARLYAAELPTREELRALHRAFRDAERPLVIHCKSGADRSGFGAALYLILICDTPVAEARRHLHWQYFHFKTKATGILDFFLETYQSAQAETGISLPDWIEQCYDPKALTAAYRARRNIR